MRAAAAVLLLASVTGNGQIVVDQRRLGPILAKFEDSAPGDTLRCSTTAIRAHLNYSLRFQAGYVMTIPMGQFEGSGHRWRMITRITPEGGDRNPVYLAANYALPDVPKTKVELQVGGGFLLGEGSYDVRHLLVDEQERTCRKDWHADVRRERGDGAVKVAMPPNTVWDVALRGSRMLPETGPARAPAGRMTILLHAAPAFPRRTRLRQNDIMTLLASVTSILERVPVSSVRLVAFSLDQQKELYQRDGFTLADLPAVADAMTRTELGLVDVRVLQNKRGHVDTLADLVNQEIKDPPDVLLFVGPTSRFADRVPATAIERPPAHAPQVLFLQLLPAFRGGRGPIVAAQPTLPDSIRSAVSRLGGKTLTIRSPADLAKAIAKVEQPR